MDQHPIPQNVTGFQFKLIGSMTVKQFGYLAVGIVGAVIVYYIPLKGLLAILLKIILIPLFGASGAIVAFIPIDGRPIDVMAGNFLKALFSPNQYVYHKGLKKFSFSTIQLRPASSGQKVVPKSNAVKTQKASNDKSQELRKILMKSSTGKIKNPQDEKENSFLKTFLSLPQQNPPPVQLRPKQPTSSAPSAPIPTPLPNIPPSPEIKPPAAPSQTQATSKSNQESALSQTEDLLKKQLEEAKQQETKSSVLSQNATHQKTLDLQKQLDEIHAQKVLLEEEILNLKKELAASQIAVATVAKTPKPQIPTGTKIATHVRSIPQDQSKRVGVLTPDTPNVISGTVKDPRGNVLPNILVEIKDKSGNPVRAFKTNALGNFASATPLTSGTYTITLEDLKKQHTFDSIQITAANQIMLPIEIISYDKREELRKELFS